MPLWEHTLQVELPESNLIVERNAEKKLGKYRSTAMAIGRAGKHDRLPALMITPETERYEVLCLLVHDKGKSAYLDDHGEPRGLAKELLDHNHTVILVDTFLTGELADEKASAARNHSPLFSPRIIGPIFRSACRISSPSAPSPNA